MPPMPPVYRRVKEDRDMDPLLMVVLVEQERLRRDVIRHQLARPYHQHGHPDAAMVQPTLGRWGIATMRIRWPAIVHGARRLLRPAITRRSHDIPEQPDRLPSSSNCMVCHVETPADDIQVGGANRRCVCVRCYTREVGETLCMPASLRRQLAAMLAELPPDKGALPTPPHHGGPGRPGTRA